jgi:hypothetical protein
MFYAGNFRRIDQNLEDRNRRVRIGESQSKSFYGEVNLAYCGFTPKSDLVARSSPRRRATIEFSSAF